MTQNISPFFVKDQNPKNLYVPSRVPFESVTAGSYGSRSNAGFESLVSSISTKTKMPKDNIREKLLQHTRSQGMDDATGAGFWDSVGSALKSVGSTVWNGIKDVVEHPVDAVSSVAKVASML
jgi:hypothetical protein